MKRLLLFGAVVGALMMSGTALAGNGDKPTGRDNPCLPNYHAEGEHCVPNGDGAGNCGQNQSDNGGDHGYGHEDQCGEHPTVEPPVDHPPVVTPPVDRCPPGMTPTAGKDGEPGNDECEFPKTTPTTPVATPPVVQVVYVDRPVVKTVTVVKKVKAKGKTKVVVKKVKVVKRVVVKLPKPDVPKKAPKTL